MCLSVPGKIVEMDGDQGVVDVEGNQVSVNLMCVEGVTVGDYVLVHAGVAIEKYDEQEALETLALLKEALDETPGSV